MKVYPNPGSVLLTFNWEFPLLEETAIIRIKDVLGGLIAQYQIKAKQGQWIWDTREIDNGVYLYEISCSDNSLAKGKVVVNK